MKMTPLTLTITQFIQKINKKIHPKNLPTKASQPHQGGGVSEVGTMSELYPFCFFDGTPNEYWLTLHQYFSYSFYFEDILGSKFDVKDSHVCWGGVDQKIPKSVVSFIAS